ncbi:MAG: hypothetical protein ACLVJN_07890 [Streptococcus parasanguinis]
MKKLVSWYKKKDKELETHFTAGLLQINFVTNALILLAFTFILLLGRSTQEMIHYHLAFCAECLTMEVAPWWTVAFTPNILVIILWDCQVLVLQYLQRSRGRKLMSGLV